jgi:DnaJ-class molecular chaperone
MADNYYHILKVDKSATDEEIKKAYRRLALEFHPDQNSSDEAEDKIKEINKAYSILSDDDKKRYYDFHGTAPRTNGPSGQADYGGFGRGVGFGRGRGCGCGHGFGVWASVFRKPSQSILKEGNDYVCRISVNEDELKNGAWRSFMIQNGGGVSKITITIPFGSKRGQRITAAEVAGEDSGRLIVELN